MAEQEKNGAAAASFAEIIKAHAQDRPLPKRFYKQAEVREANGGFTVTLDGRSIKTPLKNPLIVPNAALAGEIAAEWNRQGEHIDPAAMPLTRLSNTAIDRVAPDKMRIMAEILAYGSSDLLCYRANDPDPLVARQCALWDPILDWAAEALGVKLVTATGVIYRQQPKEALAKLETHLDGYDAFGLTGLHNMTTLSGSAIVALAVAQQHLDPEQGWTAAHLDEDWQAEQWGEDPAAVRRRALRKAEFDSAVLLLRLTHQP
ncbi:ATP12 family chaperone protein [Rhodoligotrophos defluvii]|uniref:ATP12 family chaperone protein n=1 Tax=Rhodoligotrophos defluvii TaxID=2561934 RepID=UPI0010C97090|nr:ATP12 family protein [Rhodoligotrophos defluvii]